MKNKLPYILAIDTSCDETAVAVTCGVTVISNVIASQVELHKPYGGVFPTVAKQAHRENSGPAVTAALKRAHLTPKELSAVAVTQGPGLAPALEVGLTYAKELATQWNVPLIAINHLEGHVLSVLARPHTKLSLEEPKPSWPVLAVQVSGRHTQFIRVQGFGKYEVLGESIDDAAGEVLDKVGRMLGLGYPAGPVIEEFSKRGDDTVFQFPLPMTTSGNYNLSFSGMKTFARNKLEALEADHSLNKTQIYDFAASFQKSIFRAITYKLNKILQTEQFSEVWLGGGVAANSALRHQLRLTLKPYGLPLRTPYTKKLCGDNAAMIGVAAAYHLARGSFADPTDLDRKPRWPISAVHQTDSNITS